MKAAELWVELAKIPLHHDVCVTVADAEFEIAEVRADPHSTWAVVADVVRLLAIATPFEPTEEMLHAARLVVKDPDAHSDEYFENLWQAMHAAYK